MKDIRLRFRFDAKAQDSKIRTKSKQRVSSMTTKDDNEWFSAVKEENDFNDSSWLAKLVNGIEENDNMNKSPLSEMTNITSKNTSCLHTKKTSLNNIFTVEKKISEENIIVKKKCKISELKEKSKSKDKDMETDQMKVEQKENKKESKKNINNMKQINDKKTVDYGIKERRKCAFLNKRDAKAHKNSLINYSSIKEEEQSMEKCEKNIEENDIGIDLNDISLRTEFSKENTPTPVQIRSRDTEEKYLTNINTPEKKIEEYKPKPKLETVQTRTWSSHLNSKTEEKSKSLISKETHSDMRDNSTRIKNVEEENNVMRDISSTDLVSENEFLDVLKNENQITFIETPIVKIGSIRKNKINKLIPNRKVEVDRLELFSIKQGEICSQVKPPTFNERPPHEIEVIKKEEKIGSRVSHSSRNSNVCKDISVSSVRKEKSGLNGLFCSNLYSSSASMPTSKKYVEIFKKLDGKGEGVIYKDNCNEIVLKREDKYEFGSIISKIKYLDLVLSQENFLIECEKIHKALLDKENICVDNRLTDNKIEIKYAQPLSADNLKVRKQLFPKNDLVDFQNYDYFPLFPENKDTEESNEREAEYDEREQMGKHIDERERGLVSNKGLLGSKPEINEIGNKIDSLNSKLTNYIKNNDLEDTYSRFKLEFVELRKNMFH